MPFSDILFDVNDNVARLTVNRPGVMNAFDLETIAQLKDALEECEKNAEVRVVVLMGEGGKAFSTGADIDIFRTFDVRDAQKFWRFTGQGIHRFIEKMTKPVLVIVTGYCLGGGLEIVLACDYVIASEDSKFGFPEINLGLVPGWGGTQRIARVLGRQKAKEFVMLGEMFDALEAQRLGIVNKVVPRDSMEAALAEVVAKLKAKNRVALGYAKDAVNQAYEVDLVSGLLYETELDTALISSNETRDLVNAFFERRKTKQSSTGK